MGVFSKNQLKTKPLNRNNFDVSRQHNLTFNYGYLVPFSIRETLPGESVKIRPYVGLRFMPTYFPIQNKIKAYVNYFYVRSRNLWDKYKQFAEDQLTDSSGNPHPYLGFSSSVLSNRKDVFKVGGLADYLGVSVTRHVSENESVSSDFTFTSSTNFFRYPLRFSNVGNSPVAPVGETLVNSLSDPSGFLIANIVPFGSDTTIPNGYCVGSPLRVPNNSSSSISGRYRFSTSQLHEFCTDNPEGSFSCFMSFGFYKPSNSSFCPITFGVPIECPQPDSDSSMYIDVPSTLPFDIPSGSVPCFFCFKARSAPDSPSVVVSSTSVNWSKIPNTNNYFYYGTTGAVSISDTLDTLNPYSSTLDSENFTALNALPFRAYEQIYNAFYRDERNNPLFVDGKPVYDEFLQNIGSGEDNTPYVLRRRNWEQDFLTTALPTPQQGSAPLVGITASGIASFVDPDTGKNYTVRSVVDDDGDTVINAEFTQESIDQGITPAVSRALVNYATSGISINDFRNVNALQRWKETNLRRGRKYKDLMEARFGVHISYAEMNMPEFIGGASFDVTPVQVNQTVNNGSDDPLGSYAGQLYASGQSKHPITKFCDEAGYIIGIISVVPVPVYETVMSKFWFKNNILDYWQPEFNHIGLQPIPYREVDLFGKYREDPSMVGSEFGYQRPWYDYISSFDTVHGQFRTTLSPFVMFRHFSAPPVLSEDFLLVSNDSTDDVFSVKTDSDGNIVDKIIGQIYEDYVVKSPVSKFGIARLE